MYCAVRRLIFMESLLRIVLNAITHSTTKYNMSYIRKQLICPFYYGMCTARCMYLICMYNFKKHYNFVKVYYYMCVFYVMSTFIIDVIK